MKAIVYGVERDLPDETFGEWVARTDTAVVSIDMHEGHLSTDPMCPCPAPRGREIIAPVNDFHRAARALSVPIIHVRSVLRRTGEDDIKGLHPAAWRTVFPLTVGDIPGMDEHAIQGTRWTEFATEVLDSDLIVETKRRLSPFYPTDLDFLLRSMGIKRVVFNGGMADCCVLNATFDASNLGYRVCVAADLVRGSFPEMEEAALKMVSLHTGVVMNAADILAVWSACDQ
ncbi:cysteine hydrolase family protein [Pseudooceanicola algae]|uniref:Peroxyureidoacrylate/ureidoacrylate amidohydrolase RutB n=1 Tax=Pseudooceanicola algae TaxID=1537215 RepID=A0A418SC66_9RHOB|nr:isochorismatase family cysteine hydrolase [Pseudooceanicola algae]QPM90002.1 Peroxyureidoacrylate/ureidoacrylate amidohydrolase RutB [Pseudooceanicola algae]